MFTAQSKMEAVGAVPVVSLWNDDSRGVIWKQRVTLCVRDAGEPGEQWFLLRQLGPIHFRYERHRPGLGPEAVIDLEPLEWYAAQGLLYRLTPLFYTGPKKKRRRWFRVSR